MKEFRICLCRNTMKRIFTILKRSPSGRKVMALIVKRTKDQFPARKSGRQKRRTAKQRAATRRLIAFNKRRRR